MSWVVSARRNVAEKDKDLADKVKDKDKKDK